MIYDGTWHMPDDESGEREATLTLDGQTRTIPAGLAEELVRALETAHGLRVQTLGRTVDMSDARDITKLSTPYVFEMVLNDEIETEMGKNHLGEKTLMMSTTSVIRANRAQIERGKAAVQRLIDHGLFRVVPE